MENHVSTRIIVKHALLLRIYTVAVTVACVLQVQNERTNIGQIRQKGQKGQYDKKDKYDIRVKQRGMVVFFQLFNYFLCRFASRF